MFGASYKANFLWMLLPLLLVTLHLIIGERTAHSLAPDLDVLLNTGQTSPHQERQVKFQVALAFQNRERAAIREVTLSVRGPRSFDADLPLVEGEFDLSGIQGVVGTLTGTVRMNGVATPLPSLYKSNSTGGTILIDTLWIPGDDATVNGSYVAQVVVKLEDAPNPLPSKRIAFALAQPTPTPTSTFTVTLTPTPTSTMTPTATSTPTRTPTRTPKPTRTKTPTPTRTAVPTSAPTATYTPVPTDTVTPIVTPIPTYTAVPTILITPLVADTPAPTQTPASYLYSLGRRQLRQSSFRRQRRHPQPLLQRLQRMCQPQPPQPYNSRSWWIRPLLLILRQRHQSRSSAGWSRLLLYEYLPPTLPSR